jgi:hypothetical protein
MMALSSLRPDTSLVEFLESHARGESIKELVARTVVAFALVLGGLGPLRWGRPVLATFSLAYFSYAAWGLLDRARSYSIKAGWRFTAQYLRILCGLFVGLGVGSGIGLIFAIGFALLGSPWIL